jgi:hypothetical protein
VDELVGSGTGDLKHIPARALTVYFPLLKCRINSSFSSITDTLLHGIDSSWSPV